jgi:hypothetical protein
MSPVTGNWQLATLSFFKVETSYTKASLDLASHCVWGEDPEDRKVGIRTATLAAKLASPLTADSESTDASTPPPAGSGRRYSWPGR